MKKLFALLFALSASPALCQIRTDSLGKLSFGYFISPEYAYRSYKYAKNDSVNYDLFHTVSNKQFVEMLDTIEYPKLGFRTGFFAEYMVSKRIDFITGIIISNKGEKQNFWSGDGINMEKYVITHTYSYLTIPLLAKCRFNVRTFIVYTKLGLNCNILLRKYSVFKPEFRRKIGINGSIHFTKPLTKTDWADFCTVTTNFSLGLGIEHRLNENWSIFANPVFNRDILRSIEISRSIDQYHYSVGVETGIKYNLKR